MTGRISTMVSTKNILPWVHGSWELEEISLPWLCYIMISFTLFGWARLVIWLLNADRFQTGSRRGSLRFQSMREIRHPVAGFENESDHRQSNMDTLWEQRAAPANSQKGHGHLRPAATQTYSLMSLHSDSPLHPPDNSSAWLTLVFWNPK